MIEVDYQNPSNPNISKPIDIKGCLTGISSDGSYFYSVECEREFCKDNTAQQISIHALSYDGEKVGLLDTISISNYTMYFYADVVYDHLMVLNETQDKESLQVYRLDDKAKIIPVTSTNLPAQTVQARHLNDLLLLKTQAGDIGVYSLIDPSQIYRLTGINISQCQSVDLDKVDGDKQKGLWLPVSLYNIIFTRL